MTTATQWAEAAQSEAGNVAVDSRTFCTTQTHQRCKQNHIFSPFVIAATQWAEAVQSEAGNVAVRSRLRAQQTQRLASSEQQCTSEWWCKPSGDCWCESESAWQCKWWRAGQCKARQCKPGTAAATAAADGRKVRLIVAC